MCQKSIFESLKKIHMREKGYKNAMLKLIQQFEPLINKYSFLLKYEDSKPELILVFIETIYKIPIYNSKFKKDKYIISYINKSIRNAYIN